MIKLFLILFLLFPIYKSLANKDIDNKKLVKLFSNKKINNKLLYKRCIDTFLNLNQSVFKNEKIQYQLESDSTYFNLFCKKQYENKKNFLKTDYKKQNVDKFNNLRGYKIKQSNEHFENKNCPSNYLNIFNYFDKNLNSYKSKNLRGTNIFYDNKNKNDNSNKLSLYNKVLKIFYFI